MWSLPKLRMFKFKLRCDSIQHNIKKTSKYSGIYLTKEMQALNIENYKLFKESKALSKCREIPCSSVE